MADPQFSQNLFHQFFDDTGELILNQPPLEEQYPELEQEGKHELIQDPAIRAGKIINNQLPSGINLGYVCDADNQRKNETPLTIHEGVVLETDVIKPAFAPLLFSRGEFAKPPGDIKLKSNFVKDLLLQTHADGTPANSFKQGDKDIQQAQLEQLQTQRRVIENRIKELRLDGIPENDRQMLLLKAELNQVQNAINPNFSIEQKLQEQSIMNQQTIQLHRQNLQLQDEIANNLIRVRGSIRAQQVIKEEDEKDIFTDKLNEEKEGMMDAFLPKETIILRNAILDKKKFNDLLEQKDSNIQQIYNRVISDLPDLRAQAFLDADFKEEKLNELFNEKLSDTLLGQPGLIIPEQDTDNTLSIDFRAYPEQLRETSAGDLYKSIDYEKYVKGLKVLGKKPSIKDDLLFKLAGADVPDSRYMFDTEKGLDGVIRLKLSTAASKIKKMTTDDLTTIVNMIQDEEGLLRDPDNIISFNSNYNKRVGGSGPEFLAKNFITNLNKKFVSEIQRLNEKIADEKDQEKIIDIENTINKIDNELNVIEEWVNKILRIEQVKTIQASLRAVEGIEKVERKKEEIIQASLREVEERQRLNNFDPIDILLQRPTIPRQRRLPTKLQPPELNRKDTLERMREEGAVRRQIENFEF